MRLRSLYARSCSVPRHTAARSLIWGFFWMSDLVIRGSGNRKKQRKSEWGLKLPGSFLSVPVSSHSLSLFLRSHRGEMIVHGFIRSACSAEGVWWQQAFKDAFKQVKLITLKQHVWETEPKTWKKVQMFKVTFWQSGRQFFTLSRPYVEYEAESRSLILNSVCFKDTLP